MNQLTLLFLPLLFGGTFHMIAVKKKWLNSWNRPISTKLFGKNKTFRGVLFMMGFTWIGTLILNFLSQKNDPYYGLIGLVVGGIYMLGELPNSYIKRRFGLASGDLPQGTMRYVVLITDSLDSFLPITWFYMWLYHWSWNQAIQALVFFIASAIVAKKLMQLVRIK